MSDAVAPGRQVAGSEPPVEFVRQVRDALARLYDPANLMQHPLRATLAGRLPQIGDPARNLREFLLDAVEALDPVDHPRASERERRPYLVLIDRYVGGFSPEQICARLHISPRQFRREHHLGLQALASALWLQGGGSPPAAGADDAGLREEVESLRVELEALPPGQVLAAARPQAEALARHDGVALTVAAQADGPLCLCDRTLAKQAVLSSLSAALECRSGGLAIAVAAHEGLPAVRLTVSPPLPEERLEALAQGLAACRSLMAHQGGRVDLVPGRCGGVAAVALVFRPATSAHILVVDDNERMLRLYERYLAGGRYRVSTATSAQEAEAAIATAVPDAMVLDVMMRDVDGWDLLQRLRANPALRSVPILVCSVLNEPKLALALGAQAYLRKPIAAEDLLQALASLLA